MKHYLLKTILFLALVIPSQMLIAQSGFDSTMRSSGRIYVVIGVLVIILLGLFAYMIRVEKKLKKLEEDTKN